MYVWDKMKECLKKLNGKDLKLTEILRDTPKRETKRETLLKYLYA
jgi:hypothetical protein